MRPAAANYHPCFRPAHSSPAPMQARCLLRAKRACLAAPSAGRLLFAAGRPTQRRRCETYSMAARALQV